MNHRNVVLTFILRMFLQAGCRYMVWCGWDGNHCSECAEKDLAWKILQGEVDVPGMEGLWEPLSSLPTTSQEDVSRRILRNVWELVDANYDMVIPHVSEFEADILEDAMFCAPTDKPREVLSWQEQELE